MLGRCRGLISAPCHIFVRKQILSLSSSSRTGALSSFTSSSSLSTSSSLTHLRSLSSLSFQNNLFSSQSSLATPRRVCFDIGKKEKRFVESLSSFSSSSSLETPSSENAFSLLSNAAQGNTSELRGLLNKGIDVNMVDYDSRSALHLAASEGHFETVKLLVERGANVNAVDRFGGTPLQDAFAARRKDIASYLRQSGGRLGDSIDGLVMEVCRAAAAGNVSVLENFFENSFLAIKDIYDYNQRTTLHLASNGGHMEAVEYLLRRGADPHQKNRFGLTAYDEADQEGFHELAAYLRDHQNPASEEERGTGFSPELLAEHYNAVKSLLLKNKLYAEDVILSELDWYYYSLGFPSYYYKRFPPEQAYRHLEAFIAAKQVAFANGTPENIQIDGIETSDGTILLCSDDPDAICQMEALIENFEEQWNREQNGTCLSVFHFISRGPAIPQGKKKISLFIVDKTNFEEIEKIPRTETDLRKISGPNFAIWRRKKMMDQIQSVLQSATKKIAPIFEIISQEDATHVMLAMRRDSHYLPLPKYTQILKANGLNVTRKVVEQFGNGIVMYSMYFQPGQEERIRSILNDLSLMLIGRQSEEILPLYLDGKFNATEYAFSTMVGSYVYYFLSHKNEDLEALFESLKGEPEIVAHLENVRRSLKQEIISMPKIGQTITAYPDVIKSIVELFKEKYGGEEREGEGEERENEEREDWREEWGRREGEWEEKMKKLEGRISREAESEQDREILEHILNFNRVCVKTNFFKLPKTALAVRIDPSLLLKDHPSYPQVPYGVFMMMGNDFHGFHVRFNDVARGGIRLVHSARGSAFMENYETAFFENYNLARTQNRKNKDIPEFGSKGVILLYPRGQSVKHAGDQAFKKYISAMLDLILKDRDDHHQMRDFYGQEEIIFCGPDENTAHLMEWAASYSKRRGYPYWKAFTTGKPPSMGGIPHDEYGMTTTSVHQYVLEALKSHNLKEEEVTKFQTGGPDGDLGSNEITISHDKTIAIVDGSGVIYDPKGLNRDQLMTLALERDPIQHFDASYLSPEGFKVLIHDNDVTLPDGTLISSGMHFRNEFHLTPYSSADLFVPCGGRPESVNSKNVHRFLGPDGMPRFKFIVEGANLFLTQDARSFLEGKGVVLYKDASSNKGGVTSSSLEVLVALALTDEEHATHMCVHPDEPEPEFYRTYVEEVKKRVRENAVFEYHCIAKAHQETGMHRHLLTDQLSDKINEIHAQIGNSDLFSSQKLKVKVMQEAIPIQLQEIVPGGLEGVLERLPESYVKTVFCTHLSSSFVYQYGLSAGDFAFFQFMSKWRK